MARGTIKQRIALEGGDKLQADLENLGKAGEQAFAKIKAAGDKAGFDKTETGAKNLKASLDAAGASAQSFGQKLAGTFGTFGRDLGAAASGVERLAVSFGAVAIKATAAIGGIALAAQAAASKLANIGADAATKIQDAADALGLTTDAYQKLAARADAAGVAQGAIEESFKRIDKFATEAARSVGGFGTTTSVIDGVKVSVTGFAKGLGDATGEGKKAVEVFKALGIRISDLGKASPEKRIELIAEALAKLPDGAKRSALALELLGENWRKTLAFFTLGKGEVQAATDEFAASTRKLSAAEIATGVAYKSAVTDLKDAVQATLAKIGLLFTPGATKRAEWLTKLVDDTRPATLAFAELIKAKGRLFAGEFSGPNGLLKQGLEGLAQVSKGLAVIWNSSLGPALRVVHGLIGLLTDEINRLLGTKLTAKQAEILAFVGYFVGGFGLIKLAIAPLFGLITGLATLLVGLAPILVPIGAVFVAFWDEISSGGKAAFDFLRAKTKELKTAFDLLFKGDYKGAWAIFSKIGIEAFDKIKAASKSAFDDISTVFKSLQTAILFVRAALAVVADVINGLFGTHLTAATLGIYLAFFKLAGILGTLSSLVPILAGAVNLLGSKFFILGAAALVIYRLLPDLQKLFSGLGNALTKALSGDIAGALNVMGTSFSQFWATLKDQSASTWVILAAGALVSFKKIGAGLVALMGPLGIVILAFGAWALLIGSNWTAIKKGFDEAFSPAQAGKARTFWENVGLGAGIVVKAAQGIPKAMADAFTAAAAGVQKPADGIWANVAKGAGIVLKAVQDIFTALGTGFKNTDSKEIDGYWERIGKGAKNLLEIIKQIKQTFDDLNKVTNVDVGKGIGDAVAKDFNQGLTNTKRELETLKGLFNELFGIGSAKAADAPAQTASPFASLEANATAAFDRIKAQAQEAVNAVNAIFSGSAPVAGAASDAGGGAAGAAAQPDIATAFSSIETGAKDVFERLKTLATDTVQAITDAFTKLTVDWSPFQTAADATWQGFKDKAKETADYIKQQFEGLEIDWTKLTAGLDEVIAQIKSVGTEANGAAAIVKTAADQMVTAFNNVAQAARDAAQAASSIGSGGSDFGASSDAGNGFASGGHFRGRGSSTSDSNLAWISDYEYIVQAKSVRKYGLALLNAINSGRFKMPSFSSGGLMQSVQQFKFGMPAFSGGGLATLGNPIRSLIPHPSPAGAGMVPVNIHMPGGPSIPVMASSSSLQQLARAAGHKKLTTGGTKPSWYK